MRIRVCLKIKEISMDITALIIIILIIAAGWLIWMGTKKTPDPFPPLALQNRNLGTFDLPGGLPECVERFYRELYGTEMPRIESFVLTGRGQLRFMGVTLPTRLRFIHQAGEGYRHYIETTFWGIPILRVNEYFLEGECCLNLPFGTIEDDPQTDQAANIGLWSETMMFPSVYLSASDVRWESINDHTAMLIVPFQDGEDRFTAHFNPETHMLDRMEALRWKKSGDNEKTRWQAQALEWGELEGLRMPILFAAQWMDEESPWLVARIEDVRWNVDVEEYIQGEGA